MPPAKDEEEGSLVTACPYCGHRGTDVDEAGREFCASCGERLVRFPSEWD